MRKIDGEHHQTPDQTRPSIKQQGWKPIKQQGEEPIKQQRWERASRVQRPDAEIGVKRV